MKKNLLFSLLFAFLCVLPKTAFPTHVLGASITYEHIDSLKYKVTIKMYRDCNGVALSSSPLILRCPGGSNVPVNITRTGIKNITPACKSNSTTCYPLNTYANGNGVEEHTFVATIDFNSPRYNSLANCSNKIILSISTNARVGSITTGVSGSMYIETELDLKNAPNNSSPQLTTTPKHFLACNRPVYYNIGAQDTIDNDSLSYAWAEPQKGYNMNTSYSGVFDYQNPFSVHTPYIPYTGPTLPNANPPIGLYLDPITGDIVFTPVRCNQVTVAVIKVTEWRKDSTGTYQIIGTVKQDMTYAVESAPDNNAPKIHGPYSYSVCEGKQICFDITTSDTVFVPPPPANTPAPDSTTITWNKGIPGATFTIVNDTALNQTGRFCWTPPAGSASDLMYSFTATVKDNACPYSEMATRAYKVRVMYIAQSTVAVRDLSCGNYQVNSSANSGFRGTPSYTWQVLDSNHNNTVGNDIARFQASDSNLSARNIDTLSINKEGTYVIKHTINNAPLNCPTVYYDTINVKLNTLPVFSLGPDTTFCGDSLLLTESGGSHYLWNTGDTANKTTARSTGTYWLKMTNIDNCSFIDSIEVTLLVNDSVPTLSLVGQEIRSDKTGLHAWFADSVLISGETNNYLTINTGSSKKYTAVSIDSNGCESSLSNSIKSSVGVALLPSENITVYPNPNNGSVSVSLGSIPISEIKTIKLYDVQGKELKISQTIDGQEIKLSWIGNSGMLWLAIETVKGVYRKEIIYLK